MISYKPRLQIEAWLVLPSKNALKAISIKKDIREDVANKSDSFCADTSRLRSGLLLTNKISKTPQIQSVSNLSTAMNINTAENKSNSA